MNRAFISLYVLLVLSIVTLGWGLDRLWESYGPEQAISSAKRDLISVIELRLQGQSAEHLPTTIAQMDAALEGNLKVFPLSTLAESSAGRRIAAGEIVQVTDTGGAEILYQRLGQSDQVISFSSTPQRNARQASLMHQLLLIVFYLGIALVVFFWVWPLSRDLRRLERQTRLVGQNAAPIHTQMRAGSATYELSLAFNRMAERIRELLASHKEMTYAVSHELRTPLARMKFALELAGSSENPEKMRKQILSARQDVTEMDVLVNELLAYAAFEQENRELHCQPGDLRALVEQLVTRLPAEAHKQVSIKDQLQGVEVVCEWYLMETAINNLLHNAWRFAECEVTVTMGAEGGEYYLRVEDDGPGVPEAERERVFQSFVRLSSEVNSRSSGFGLGLAIVRRILKWHHGKVILRDSSDGGACFELRWPAQG